MEKENEMNPEELAIYQWQYGLMGHFRKALMEAICRADDGNLKRLKLGFPNEVNGYIKFAQESGWWQNVQKKAKELEWRRNDN